MQSIRLKRPARSLGVAALAAAALATGGVLAFDGGAEATATPSSTLVINEVYGGGGNSGATYKNDFIELRNVSGTPIDLDGWSVQYHSASSSGAWQATALTGTLAPGDLYLVQEAAGSGGTTALPTPQATGSINMSGTSGTVALVQATSPLTCENSTDCQNASLDLVGYGTAAIYNGAAPAPTLSNTTAAERTDSANTGNNNTDFIAGAPTPDAPNNATGGTGTGTGTAPTGDPQPGPIKIHDIQSTSWVSPYNGKSVTNVPGIVTGIRSSGSSQGYWIQDPNPDNDPATSEGIFVYTGSSSTGVAVGDSVLVSGKVQNYYPLASGETTDTTSNLSTTEIDDPTATVLAHGQTLPAPIVVGPDTVPATYAPDLNGGNIESTPIQPSRSALDYWRSVEGMRVEVDNARVIGPSDTYGEEYVTTKPTQDETIRGGSELLGENQTPSGRIEVVAADGTNPEVNVGDVFQGATIGPVDYSEYGGFLIAATTLGTVQRNNLAPTVESPGKPSQLSVATYNVENLAPGDPASKFQALASGVVTNLDSPDILAVEEVQDDDGATDDGVTAADQTISKLESAIVAAGGPQYSSQEIDPSNDQDGGEPGGNIRVVFLYNAKRVSFVQRGSASVDRTTTGTQVVDQHGQPDLTLSPGRIDPNNPVWSSSRKPLVGEFEFAGKPVFVIANHFDAKLGDQNQDGRFQYPAQSSQIQRAGQAQVEHDFVQQLLNVDPSANVVVVGDLNDYQFSPALSVLKTGNADGKGRSILDDLITTLPTNQQYTYDYEGVSEVLDHILVSGALAKSAQYQVIHINSEYANQTSDHDPQEVRLSPQGAGPHWPGLPPRVPFKRHDWPVPPKGHLR